MPIFFYTKPLSGFFPGNTRSWTRSQHEPGIEQAFGQPAQDRTGVRRGAGEGAGGRAHQRTHIRANAHPEERTSGRTEHHHQRTFNNCPLFCPSWRFTAKHRQSITIDTTAPFWAFFGTFQPTHICTFRGTHICTSKHPHTFECTFAHSEERTSNFENLS